ncbi:M12 family metallopeptidase [Streptomyces sp. NBC_01465]|uniref:M12 family metallopeptidase n=1 Tax=Streptomyces sp. NBC_01465 TaxID=2903878 RepID=UPI002E33C3B7|nr:M12 family metallopeptidase [Streptomyces sp. NBC_01465]
MADEQMHPADVPEEKHGEDSGEQQPGGKVIRTALITGETFEVRAVRYAVVDGLAVVEGDIVLGRDEDVRRRTDELREKAAQGAAGVGDGVLEGDAVDLTKFVGVRPTAVVIPWQGRRWPGGVVPFVLDVSLTSTARTAITTAISHWHDRTRLALRPRNGSDAAWLNFRDASVCRSSVGRQGGSQDVEIGVKCGISGTIHEIGHAVGLWHEQSREDRDFFVSIIWANIVAGEGHNFDQNISDGDDVGPYDYGSIMHYGPTAFGVINPATGQKRTTIVAEQQLPPGVTMGGASGLSVGDRGAVATMYPGVYPGPRNVWLGRFRGQPGTDVLYYSPARQRWYLGRTNPGAPGTLVFSDVSDTSGFGDLADGRPFWTGDFTGDGATDIIFHFPGDQNWILGTVQNGQLGWSLVGNTAGFGDVTGNPFWTGDFTGNGRTELLFYYAGDQNWWLGSITGGQLSWTRVAVTTGFGDVTGNPVWAGDFTGDGRTELLFHYPGDQNWWLGSVTGGQLSFDLVGNTAGFGDVSHNPFWTGDFTGDGKTDIIFHYPGDRNWWLGTIRNGQLTWAYVGNTTGFGDVTGNPFWTGDFTGDGKTDIVFHYPGDENWWLGSIQLVPPENARCAVLRSEIAGHRAEIRTLQDIRDGLDPKLDREEIREINRQITAIRQAMTSEQSEMATLACPVTPNPGGLQLVWSLIGNTAGFGSFTDGRPVWAGDFTGDGRTDLLFHYRGDLNWWRGSVDGSLNWTLAANW